MSGVGEAFLALKNVMLLHERVERLQSELEGVAAGQKEIGAAVMAIDRRLSRLEGFLEGAAAANARLSALPKD